MSRLLTEAEMTALHEGVAKAVRNLQALAARARAMKADARRVPIRKGTTMSAWDEITQLAKAKVEKGLSPTREQAVVTVVRERPDLAQRYRTEPRPVIKQEITTTSDAGPAASVWSEICGEAKRFLSTRTDGMTLEQAIVEVTRRNPALVARYRAARRQETEPRPVTGRL